MNRKLSLSLSLSLSAAALAVMAALPLAAQTPDSAFAVSKAGVSLFRVNVDAGVRAGGTFDGDAFGTGVPQEGAGTRMMWYPRKAAFRAGYVNGTQWDAANIGAYSVALGINVRASGDSSVALGASATAAQAGSFAAGVHVTASGAASVAMGYAAHTNARQGSFVFGDRSTVDTIRAGVNHSANWRVSGGFRIFNSSNLSTGVIVLPATAGGSNNYTWSGCGDHLGGTVFISTSTCATLTNGGAWTNSSDVNRKHLFEDVSGEAVLSRLRTVPIRSWSYKAENSSIRHLGPTAQDFRAAFGLGANETSITTVDADGVALAGVKALDARTLVHARTLDEQGRALAAQQRTIEAQGREIADLRARLERIEAALAAQKP
ncbi:MAG TPA: tail fiber domain-containing protein [Longimicrobium sp.]|nr:tail fiber domain-containing protein [Longimicrobium sp.]